MKAIGERLRQERLRRGLDLYQIADRTKINPALLEAIEEGDPSRLPGMFFAKSFIRQYAQALGLDDSVLEAELQQLAAAEPALPAPRGPELDFPPIADSLRPRGEQSIGAWLALVLIIAACSGIYMFWQRSHEAGPERAAQQHQEAPAQPQAAPAQPAPPAPQAAAPGAPAAAPSVGAEANPHSPAASPQTPPAAEAQLPAAPPAVPAAPEVRAAIRVEVRATAPAWIRVAADGKYVFSGTVQPDQPRAFGAATAMNIRTGNAGALALTFNGKTVPALGPQGQIRTVEFTPSEFKVLAPPPKPPAPAGEPSGQPPPAAL